MGYKTKIYFITLILIFSAGKLLAAPKETSTFLNYTYIGPTTGFGGYNTFYKGWNSDSSLRVNDKYAGMHFTGGVALNIFTQYVIADFKIQYIYNLNLSDTGLSLMHLMYSISGKYIYNFNKIIGITVGLGVYFESPPSNVEFKGGAGGLLLFGVAISTTFDTKLILDLVAGYGFYGLGDKTSRVSYGLNIGFIFKVGRL